jgi:hypothetical protein
VTPQHDLVFLVASENAETEDENDADDWTQRVFRTDLSAAPQPINAAELAAGGNSGFLRPSGGV